VILEFSTKISSSHSNQWLHTSRRPLRSCDAYHIWLQGHKHQTPTSYSSLFLSLMNWPPQTGYSQQWDLERKGN